MQPEKDLMKKHKPYTELAPHYDRLMSHINYEGWAAYIADNLLEYITPQSRVLEIAAGTGKLSDFLRRIFPKWYVSEYSLEMIKRADKKITRIACDMQYLPFVNRFDAACCTFDSINYLTSVQKLLKTFREVNSVLKTDGIFCFDVSLEKNSHRYVKYVRNEIDLPQEILSQHSWYNPESRFHYNYFYFRDSEGKLTREVHKQKIFHFDTYYDVFRKTGFEVLKVYKSFTYNKGKKSDDRIFFILRKSK